ncbi:DUF177 domain-containing protein [Jiella endophytica]|uniref:DUF177 domain-containing protein n=1 Tax=Jiella endophytica TaxID=2558362 RepID=A0A4Y8RLK4_9HYPH|nr:DUF177 domain-containing protein [Jiella endophytica]TFF23326.1 DUF177 domain-containing protein [Jiella endophytica]
MDGDRTTPLQLFLPVATLPQDGRRIDYAATPEELTAIAAALQIETARNVTAELLARPFRKDGARVTGRIAAILVQKSVVTLEPVIQSIDEPFEATFVREAKAPRRQQAETAEIIVDPEAEDPPESFVGDKIDLGAKLFETLVLALDPYPRRPGESFGAAAADEDEDDDVPSPFAALADFRKPERNG